ncbi:GTP-binding protein RAD-like protein, partial [Dinothrombium tinctorium]
NEKFAAVLFMYSVTDKGSFEAVRKYLSAMACDYNKFSKLAIILVANKSDLVRSRVVSTNEGKFLAEAFQIKYIETSAEINHNINELLVGIGKQIKLKQEQQMLLASNETLRSCSFSSSSSLAHQNATLVKRKHSSFAQKMLQKLLGKSKRKSCDNLFVP